MSIFLQWLATALLTLPTASALVYSQLKPTPLEHDKADGIRGWTPKPTADPQEALRRRWGAMPINQLLARQDEANQATCGWYNADPLSPVVCAGGSSSGCAYYPASAGGPPNFWCCSYTGSGLNYGPDPNDCAYISTCLGYNDPGNSNNGDQVGEGGGQIQCPSAAPACVTTVLYGPNGTTFSQLGCDVSTYQVFAYQTTTTASTTAPSVVSVQSDIPTAMTTTSPVQSSVKSTTSPQSVSSASSTQASTSAATSKPDVGAIAGGTVGGVAAVAIVGAVIGYLVWRKRSQRKAPVREVSQYNAGSP